MTVHCDGVAVGAVANNVDAYACASWRLANVAVLVEGGMLLMGLLAVSLVVLLVM
jgi:hypothetical protein